MNVLFLTHRLPYAPNRGDRIRAYYLMRELARFSKVSLISLVHDDEEAGQAGTVPFATSVGIARVPRLAGFARGALRLPTSIPLTHSLLDSPEMRSAIERVVRTSPPDVVVAYCSSMARFALEPPLSGIPMVLDMVDVDSAKWAELATHAAWPKSGIYRREARTLEAFERVAAEAAHAVLVVTDREQALMQRIAPHAHTHVMYGVDIDAYTPPGPPEASSVVVMTGVMNYAPNVGGVTWLAREVWPRVVASRPDARLVIVGSSPTRDILALAEHDPSIEVTGSVPAVQPYLWSAAVAVAPLHVARGIQNKVLEALAAGLPAVITPAVDAGLPEGIARGCVAAESPAEFAAAVLALLALAPEARRARAQSSGVEEFSWALRCADLRRIVEGAMRKPVLEPLTAVSAVN